MNIDGAGIHVGLILPDMLQKFIPADDGAAVVDKELQQLHLLGGKLDGFTVFGGLSVLEIDVHIAELKAENRSKIFTRDAAQQGFDAGEQFVRVEGLGQVVVRAEFEADNTVNDTRLGSEHQNCGIYALLAKFLADIEAIFAGKHDVEQYEVMSASGGLGQTFGTGGGGFDLIAFRGQ